MLNIVKNFSLLLLVFPPVYIAIRFFRWSMHSLEKEMAIVASVPRRDKV